MELPKRLPSAWVSFAVLGVLMVLIAINVTIYGVNSLDGSVQVVLLVATGVCCAVSMACYGIKFKTLEESMLENIKGAGSVVVMLLLIGALSGVWMLSGVVPSLIYYGLKIISPSVFLVTACIVSAVVSISTGSSWTTCATIGVALMGVGNALGFHEGWTAGAVISGAYFGDKLSPLSDTTNMAAGTAGADIFEHIKYMLITTIPSMLIACGVYLFVGFFGETSTVNEIDAFTTSLAGTYNITPWLFIVPALTFLMIIKRISALVTLFVAVVMGAIAAVLFQPELCRNIASDTTNAFTTFFTGIMNTMYGPTATETGNAALNRLVSTRGMSGMLNTVWLILCSMCFGGAMQGSGMLASISHVIIRWMRSTVTTVGATLSTGILFNMITADHVISIVLSGNMYRSVYEEQGYEPRLLSRSLEDSATVTSVLIPWCSCSMAQSTVLGVAAITFAPYCIFNWLSPIVSIIIAATGYKIKRVAPKVAEVVAEPVNA